MPTKLDKTDKQIVDLLIDNGRLSCSDIARELGNVSERSVRYRLDRLIREGIIQVRAIVSPGQLGYTVIGDVLLEVEPGQISNVVQKLLEFDHVTYLASSIGETDISVQIVAKNNSELYSFVTEVIGKLPGVRKTTTSIVPFKHKDVYQWRIPDSIIGNDTPKET